MKRIVCRSCDSPKLKSIISFGDTPLSEVLLREDQLGSVETKYPLELMFCQECTLVQLSVTVPPEILYSGDYPYYSSVVDTLLSHFRTSAEELIRERPLGRGNLVVEAASNDGYMLKNFLSHGIRVLGIDPAKGPAETARKAGVPTIVEFFCRDIAERLRQDGVSADAFLANNVINLVDDLNGFVLGVKALLNVTGVAVIEMPYVRDLIEKCAFDSVYHQNLSYFSATSLVALFRRHGLYINNVRRVSTFGGSLRIFVETHDAPSDSINALLNEEARLGISRFEYFQEFAFRVAEIKRELLELLGGIKREGKRIAIFGAAGGMATTLLSYVGIDRELVDFAVDSNPHKQGYYTPGCRFRIDSPDQLLNVAPEYTLLLAWNYADEIVRKSKSYLDRGGCFIVPIPTPAFLGQS